MFALFVIHVVIYLDLDLDLLRYCLFFILFQLSTLNLLIMHSYVFVLVVTLEMATYICDLLQSNVNLTSILS